MIIAIDGPAGAGKSSVAKEIAKRLSLTYIDTGAMYRALTWKALKNSINVTNETDLETLLKNSVIELIPSSEENLLKVFIDSIDVTDEIRSTLVSNSVSIVSTHKKIREIMVIKQRNVAEARQNVVMDGRDIGTVVFPDADVKIFLIASVEERANRRFKELEAKGVATDIDELIKDIKLRDKTDMERIVSPLKPAEDAIIFDTTALNYEEVVLRLEEIIKKVESIKTTENNEVFSKV